MNKGGHAAAMTAGAAAAAAARQRTLLQQADTDIGNLMENFSHLIKASKVMPALQMTEPVRSVQENFQMDVHASKMVQAADSLLKLVSQLKQTAVFSDFVSLNQHIDERVAKLDEDNAETDSLLLKFGEQVGSSLCELESHYYRSLQKNSDFPTPAAENGH